MAEGAAPTNGAHGREEDMPPSSSTKRAGKAIQEPAYDEEHDGAASLTNLIPKANADKMKRSDMDDSLKATPVPKINQPPKILSRLNDTRDHSPSRDEGRDHDDNTHTGESSITRSTGVVRDGITSPCAAELAKGTAAASSSMKSVIPDGPSIEENVNSPIGGPSSSTPSPTKAVQDALGSEEHMLAMRQPSSSSMKSRGKAIEAYDQEQGEAASLTKIIPKAIAAAACLVQMQPDAGPSVRAPAQHHDGVDAVIGGLAQANAGDVASNTAFAIPAFAQHDVNVAIPAIGGGVVARLAPVQPNAARQVPAPAQINGGGIAVIAARPAPVQPNVARQVPPPAQINSGGIAVIAARPAPVQPNVPRQVPAPALINGGGIAVIAARPAPVQPNVPRQVPAPAQINGGGIAVIAARLAPAQLNAGGPAPNVAPPVLFLPPNPGLNNIDEVLMNSGIRPLRNPADGDEGKLWDKLN